MPDFLPFKGYKEKIFFNWSKKKLPCVYIWMWHFLVFVCQWIFRLCRFLAIVSNDGVNRWVQILFKVVTSGLGRWLSGSGYLSPRRQPDFHPWRPATPKSCPLTTTYTPWYVSTHAHIQKVKWNDFFKMAISLPLNIHPKVGLTGHTVILILLCFLYISRNGCKVIPISGVLSLSILINHASLWVSVAFPFFPFSLREGVLGIEPRHTRVGWYATFLL